MVVYGVDGCPGGWFFVRKEGSHLSFEVTTLLAHLVREAPVGSSIFIDVPIGLRDAASLPRECDIEARKLLGPRKSSVFPAPIREILDETDHSVATAKSHRICGKGISKQGFAIIPKIREVDELLRGNHRARGLIREVHPELCFWALAGGKPLKHPKKRKEGFEERMHLLEKILPGARDMADEALSAYKRRTLSRDDVADALVALTTAARPKVELRTLPRRPERDSRDLPMEMVYSICVGAL